MSNVISAKQVSELRQKTGAGLMECKKALTESDGDIEKAELLLRKKGIATAAKKAGRATSEGLIEAYIHLGGKVGVLLELNCETDFVAKTDDFKALAKDICLQVAAAMPICVTREEVPEKDIESEKEVFLSQLEGKPAHAVEKILEGKLDKYFSGICLLEQPFVKNPDQTIRDLLNEQVTKLGENIVIRRFVRYQIGA
jgi:elongation factor Ts